MRWILAQIGLCLAALVVALPACATPRPFQVLDGQVVITVTLNGRDLPALLDTGATRSLITPPSPRRWASAASVWAAGQSARRER
ncbi:MAG: hypothetical protein EON61_10950 [Alphaproteobacteria bacterium]|nr:MAG: hypothetical protein EON61_10950 [Alphaproteobacteria bacterium]